MAKFFVKRILTAIVQIFVVTTIVFFALQMMPGRIGGESGGL